jgi:hypothetical protein
MEPGSIPDDHVLGLPVTVGNLLEETPAERQIDRGHEAKLGFSPNDFQRAINILPFIALLLRDHDPLSPQCPTTAALGMQTKPAFIGHPNLHRLIFG